MDYKYIHCTIERRVGQVRLNRPEVHHAMHPDMIRELTAAIDELQSEDIVCIHLSSPGKHFCAGADLHWMESARDQEKEEVLQESRELALLFDSLADSPLPVICSVQGRVMGGGLGLVAAADLVLAEEGSSFAFSEVKLGLIPATIAPHVIAKTGPGQSMAWMLHGGSFSAAEAREAGLVHRLCPDGGLEESSLKLLDELRANAPGAMRRIKAMIRNYSRLLTDESGREERALSIAERRLSSEAREGISAFFDKRKARWYEND